MTRGDTEKEVEALAESVGVETEVMARKIRTDGSEPGDGDD